MSTSPSGLGRIAYESFKPPHTQSPRERWGEMGFEGMWIACAEAVASKVREEELVPRYIHIAETIAELARRGFVISFMLDDNRIVASATSGGKTTTSAHFNTVAQAIDNLGKMMENA